MIQYHPRAAGLRGRLTSYAMLAAAGCLPAASCQKLDNHPFNSAMGSTATRSEAPGSIPVMEITTESGQGIHSKTEWKAACVTLAVPDEGTLLLNAGAKVKGRGNSTWSYPKKPFNIKFGEPLPLLGMDAACKWCMLANWLDVTQMRNAVALGIASRTSLDWTPQFRHVDLIMDGEYQGTFLLTEKPDAGHCPGDVLLCIDNHYDERWRFRSARKNLPVNIMLPDGRCLDAGSLAEIRSRVDAVEYALYDGHADWRELVDEESFCDMLIVQELSGNAEARLPRSFYLHFLPDGRIAAGPAWDFDYHTFQPGTSGIINRDSVWYDAMLQDPGFCELLRERWITLRPEFGAIAASLSGPGVEALRTSAENNLRLWPVSLNVNGDAHLGWDAALSRMQTYLEDRMAELDAAFNSLP